MKSKNLFGEMQEEVIAPVHGEYKFWKHKNNYRKAVHKEYCCGTCCNSRRNEYHSKYYWKCKLMGESMSEASDIRKNYICNKWGKVA